MRSVRCRRDPLRGATLLAAPAAGTPWHHPASALHNQVAARALARLDRRAADSRVVFTHAYPTVAHERAAQEITRFFASRKASTAVLLVNSCARGKATVDSCLDIQVIAPSAAVPRLDAEFSRFAAESDAIAELHRAGRFSDLHLDVIDGTFVPGLIDEEGIDDLEVGVGNLLVYSVPLFVRGDQLEQLRAEWLPYYGDALRSERLEATRWFILDNNLARIPWFLDRHLYFQAFDRFHRAFPGVSPRHPHRAAYLPNRIQQMDPRANRRQPRTP